MFNVEEYRAKLAEEPIPAEALAYFRKQCGEYANAVASGFAPLRREIKAQLDDGVHEVVWKGESVTARFYKYADIYHVLIFLDVVLLAKIPSDSLGDLSEKVYWIDRSITGSFVLINKLVKREESLKSYIK